MLSGISQERNARSRGHWFTEFCNSQRLSHFAAPLIGARAKISVAENCAFLSLNSQSGYNEYCHEQWKVQSPKGPMTMSNTQKLRLQRSPEYAHSPIASTCADKDTQAVAFSKVHDLNWIVRMILPQVHLRKPCYDFSFL